MERKICTRKVDELGRFVLPQEVRTELQIEKEDGLDISVEGNTILLRKHEPSCVLCRSSEIAFKQVNGKLVCEDCIALLNK